MINPELHKKPVALDREKHRRLKLLGAPANVEAAAHLNAFFITAAEFGDACKEFPILFLNAGVDGQGKPQVAPVAVFGLTKGENLFIAQGRWTGRYIPAMLRAYPFTMARLDDQQHVVCIDESWPGFSYDEGRELFDAQGQPTPFLGELHQFIEHIEVEIERTRIGGQRLLELNLLQEKRFDATMPDGTPLTVDGFMTVNEERLAALPDADVLQLQRSGWLGLLHAHVISMANMRWLVERRVAALPADAAPAAQAAQATDAPATPVH